MVDDTSKVANSKEDNLRLVKERIIQTSKLLKIFKDRETELEVLKVKLEEKQQKLEDCQFIGSRERVELETCRVELDLLGERHAQLQKRHEQVLAQLSKAEADLLKKNQQIESSKVLNQQLSEDIRQRSANKEPLEDLRKQLKHQEKELVSRSNTIAMLEKSKDQLRVQQASLQKEKSSLALEKAALEKQVQQLSNENQKLKQSLSQARQMELRQRKLLAQPLPPTTVNGHHKEVDLKSKFIKHILQKSQFRLDALEKQCQELASLSISSLIPPPVRVKAPPPPAPPAPPPPAAAMMTALIDSTSTKGPTKREKVLMDVIIQQQMDLSKKRKQLEAYQASGAHSNFKKYRMDIEKLLLNTEEASVVTITSHLDQNVHASESDRGKDIFNLLSERLVSKQAPGLIEPPRSPSFPLPASTSNSNTTFNNTSNNNSNNTSNKALKSNSSKDTTNNRTTVAKIKATTKSKTRKSLGVVADDGGKSAIIPKVVIPILIEYTEEQDRHYILTIIEWISKSNRQYEELCRVKERLKQIRRKYPGIIYEGLLEHWKRLKTHPFCPSPPPPPPSSVPLPTTALTTTTTVKGEIKQRKIIFPIEFEKVVNGVLYLPVCLSDRESYAVVFIWFYLRFLEKEGEDDLLGKMEELVILECGQDAQLGLGCRIVRALTIITKNMQDLSSVHRLRHRILLEQVEGDNVLAFIENIAKLWPAIFRDGPYVKVMQAIISGVCDYLSQVERYQKDPALLRRMYETFIQWCDWPAKEESPFLDKLEMEIQSQMQGHAADSLGDSLTHALALISAWKS